MDPWTWTRDLWHQAFQPLEDLGLELCRVDRAGYWDVHERELRAHFPPEVFFNLPALRTPAEREGQARMDESRGGTPLCDFCVVRDRGEIVAQFCGEDKGGGVYRMWHSNVRTDYRRRGIYRRILEGSIAYTRALGFHAITSEHSPSNNAILIAKLQAGFRIVSLELDPMVGPSIVLRYFHNPEHLAAYELRCSHATLTPALRAHGGGAYPLLRKQFRDEE